MVIKIKSIRNPVLGGALLVSAWSQAAGAAELPPSQPAPTPGIAAPDQAVRQMAANVILDSSSATFLARNSRPTATGIGAERIAPRQISAAPSSASTLPNPSQVLNSCPANVCGFVATRPPVDVGTIALSGINKIEQNKLNSIGNTAPKASPDDTPLQTVTPNYQVTNPTKIALSTEPGLSKDIAFLSSGPVDPTIAELKPATVAVITPAVTTVSSSNKIIGAENLPNQLRSFTSQLVANSWKLITVLPKPQLDSSLLNIGISSSFQHTDSSSFSPRFTLGTLVETVEPPEKVRFSSISPFLAPQEVVKFSSVLLPSNQLGFSAKPSNTSSSRINQFEASIKPFNIMTFLATLHTATMSPTKFGGQSQ
jgi:hypothetical protein